jgi:hypothetical protein
MYDFKSFEFGSGSHPTRDEGMCVMEAVAYVAGEGHTDRPECACPVLTAFLISWNDSLPSDGERQRLLSSFVFRLPGTRATKEIEEKRGMVALEWMIKVFTPAVLELTPSLVGYAKALRSLKVREENEAEVLSALSAAESAAESAAWSAALSAALSAAESAAESAALSAAAKFMEPTVKKLQKSAQRLLDRMIRLTEIKEKSAKERQAEAVVVSNK